MTGGTHQSASRRYIGYVWVLLALAANVAVAQSAAGRIYVQRIEFSGTEHIDDEVLRRQLLQYEGTYLNTVALEQSRLRLERLPYVESARVELEPVVGATDQTNIKITVSESPARRYGIGGGYSESQRASVNGHFINDNLLGTGQRFAARIETSEIRTAADLSYTNPFAHPDGVSRTFALAFRNIDQLTADTSEFEVNVLAGRLEYQYQIAERQSVRVGISLQDAELVAGPLASDQLLDWVSDNGSSSERNGFPTTDYLSGELLFGWHYDSRDGPVFPTSGLEQLLAVRVSVPGSDVNYYTAEYELSRYWPLTGGWVAKFDTRLGYGASYGSDTSTLPPNLNWFAGGPNSVRGYRENRLGPKDSLGNPYGGNLFTAARLELITPLPEKWSNKLQLALFYDVGNVFSTEGQRFLDDDGQPLDYGFEFSELRHSAGIAAKVLLPVGILGLSYGLPIGADEDNPNRFLRDDIERFQITIGVEF